VGINVHQIAPFYPINKSRAMLLLVEKCKAKCL
jgi:hypothetical protein